MFWAKIRSHQKCIIWYIDTACSELIKLPCTIYIQWICNNKKAYKRTPPFFLFPWYLSNICQKHLFVEERITNISFLSQEQLYLLPLQHIQEGISKNLTYSHAPLQMFVESLHRNTEKCINQLE